MGEILLREGRMDEAVAAYRRSLSFNSGQRGVYMKMIRILERTNPAEAAQIRRELAWVNSFYPAR